MRQTSAHIHTIVIFHRCIQRFWEEACHFEWRRPKEGLGTPERIVSAKKIWKAFCWQKSFFGICGCWNISGRFGEENNVWHDYNEFDFKWMSCDMISFVAIVIMMHIFKVKFWENLMSCFEAWFECIGTRTCQLCEFIDVTKLWWFMMKQIHKIFLHWIFTFYFLLYKHYAQWLLWGKRFILYMRLLR